jgi:hypothetical protein
MAEISCPVHPASAQPRVPPCAICENAVLRQLGGIANALKRWAKSMPWLFPLLVVNRVMLSDGTAMMATNSRVSHQLESDYGGRFPALNSPNGPARRPRCSAAKRRGSAVCSVNLAQGVDAGLQWWLTVSRSAALR